jgi:hypothetical protein
MLFSFSFRASIDPLKIKSNCNREKTGELFGIHIGAAPTTVNYMNAIMHNQISLRMIFALTTILAVVIACFQNLPSGVIVSAFMAMLTMLIVTFSLFALAFMLMLPFAQLGKYLDDQSDDGSSPFAQDRLPSQIIPPVDRGAE